MSGGLWGPQGTLEGTSVFIIGCPSQVGSRGQWEGMLFPGWQAVGVLPVSMPSDWLVAEGYEVCVCPHVPSQGLGRGPCVPASPGWLLMVSPHPQEGTEVTRRAGDRWLARGPLEYVPPAEVAVLERRQAVALADNEGIYVRDIRTGKVPAPLL